MQSTHGDENLSFLLNEADNSPALLAIPPALNNNQWKHLATSSGDNDGTSDTSEPG